jgi:hypothetical protein
MLIIGDEHLSNNKKMYYIFNINKLKLKGIYKIKTA